MSIIVQKIVFPNTYRPYIFLLFITISGKSEAITVSMSTIAKKYPHISDRVEPYSALKYCAGLSFLILPQPEYFEMNNTTVPTNHVSIYIPI